MTFKIVLVPWLLNVVPMDTDVCTSYVLQRL